MDEFDTLLTDPVRRLLISFSGGETSAYMTWWILTNWCDRYDEIVIVFANTGQENEETLEFVDQCDRLLFAPLGYRVTYIEAIQIHGQRKAATFRVVDFDSADRSGAVFEDMIIKYGIPNRRYPHCTRDLKLSPIQAFSASLGWGKDYDTAIGIRADEIDRMSSSRVKFRIIYPLIKQEITKPKVNTWFVTVPFRLRLKGYQSNCKWCWKKSLRKHLTLIGENPAQYDFPRQMEAKYGLHGSEFGKEQREVDYILPDGYRRVFFREGRSTEDLFTLHSQLDDTFVPAEDDSVIFEPSLDAGGGCEETCEVFADETMVDYEVADWVPRIDVSIKPELWFALAV